MNKEAYHTEYLRMHPEKRYRVTHPEKARRSQKNSQLQKRYGIDVDYYEQLLAEQNSKCAICEKDESAFQRSFHVDHDHTTGRIRGLLCVNCNTAIGKLQENVLIVERAANYLKKSY